MHRLASLLPTSFRLRKQLRATQLEVADLQTQLHRLRLEISSPSHKVLRAFLPEMGCDKDVVEQFRQALLDLEQLKPDVLGENPGIAFRLCLLDRYLQHVRYVIAGSQPVGLEAPWLVSLHKKADI